MSKPKDRPMYPALEQRIIKQEARIKRAGSLNLMDWIIITPTLSRSLYSLKFNNSINKLV